MNSVLKELYRVINERKENPLQGSYTCYLFEQGLDKILKKVGEESAEVIIAAKNGDNGATVQEICDLTYHLLVLMAQAGIGLEEVQQELLARSAKIGNLKNIKTINKDT
jgi:phosphoribosyl-ATP pyrophosphohydrolase